MSYFVKSVYADGTNDDSQIVEVLNKNIINKREHYAIFLFKDASGYPTSVSCKCGKFHRVKNGTPDVENSCPQDKACVPSIVYDIN